MRQWLWGAGSVILLGGLSSCSDGGKGGGSDDTGPGSGGEGDADTDTDTDPDTDTSALGADPACEDYEGTPIAAATGFFVGDFTFGEEDAVSGRERWVLFANARWQELGGADCEIVWNIVGTQAEPTGACGACAYSLELAATLDTQATDCPADIYAGDESFSVVYNVLVAGDAATFYYESGNTVGQGTEQDAKVSYISDGSCLYF